VQWDRPDTAILAKRCQWGSLADPNYACITASVTTAALEIRRGDHDRRAPRCTLQCNPQRIIGPDVQCDREGVLIGGHEDLQVGRWVRMPILDIRPVLADRNTPDPYPWNRSSGACGRVKMPRNRNQRRYSGRRGRCRVHGGDGTGVIGGRCAVPGCHTRIVMRWWSVDIHVSGDDAREVETVARQLSEDAAARREAARLRSPWFSGLFYLAVVVVVVALLLVVGRVLPIGRFPLLPWPQRCSFRLSARCRCGKTNA
jgi:hypothetical protein